MNSLLPTEGPAYNRQRVDPCTAKPLTHRISKQVLMEHLPCLTFSLSWPVQVNTCVLRASVQSMGSWMGPRDKGIAPARRATQSLKIELEKWTDMYQ